MAKTFSLTNLTESEGKEMLSACKARLNQLDKAFKTCIKADAIQGAEKVKDRITAIRGVEEKIQDAINTDQ